jgi:hypothetical protein
MAKATLSTCSTMTDDLILIFWHRHVAQWVQRLYAELRIEGASTESLAFPEQSK